MRTRILSEVIISDSDDIFNGRIFILECPEYRKIPLLSDEQGDEVEDAA